MHENQLEAKSGFMAYPTTRLGSWSVVLAIGFVLLFTGWLLYVSNVEVSRSTFFFDPVHAVLLLGAAASSVCGAGAAVAAVALRGERSILSLLAILLGVFVLYWVLAEIAGPG